MKKDIYRFLLGFLFILLIAGQAHAQRSSYLDDPYLETNAMADTLVTPDRIYLGIVIRESDTKGRTSLEELENKMVDALEKLGVPTRERLRVSDLSSDYRQYFLRKNEMEKNKAYSLELHDALMAGKVIQALERLAISGISLERTEISFLEELKLELRRKAVYRAQQQAKAMVEPLGQELGKAVFISDLNTEYIQPHRTVHMLAMETAKQGAQVEPANLSFDKTRVEARVNIKFALP